MQGRSKVEFANTLRGLAALSVVIAHYFGVFWFSRDMVGFLINAPILSPTEYTIPKYIPWLHQFTLLNWGQYGVALFFIISGFVIPFSLQKLNSLEFCVNRFFRIVPTYVIGFSITLLLLFASTHYFFTAWPYTFKEILIHYLPGIRDILWSRNIDGIIWTLEIEMKFYLVGALSIFWFRNFSTKVFLIPILFFLVACYLNRKLPGWEAHNISAYKLAMTYIISSQYIIFMFLGVIFHYLHCNKIDQNRAYFGVASLFALFCIDWWAGPYSASLNIAWSYGFALLTFMFAYSFPAFFKANPIANFLANISYPLYVIHALAGYVTLRVMLDIGFKAWVALTIVVFLSLSLSWLLHRFVEKPSQDLGKWFIAFSKERYLLLNRFLKPQNAIS